MREIRSNINTIAGAVAHGSENERWFLDTASGQAFLVSTEFQSEEELDATIERIKSDPDKFLALPYLSHEDFLGEVEMYMRIISDRPALLSLLTEAVKKKRSRADIFNILNRDPGQRKKFAEFFQSRVQERVAVWLERQGIKLVD